MAAAFCVLTAAPLSAAFAFFFRHKKQNRRPGVRWNNPAGNETGRPLHEKRISWSSDISTGRDGGDDENSAESVETIEITDAFETVGTQNVPVITPVPEDPDEPENGIYTEAMQLKRKRIEHARKIKRLLFELRRTAPQSQAEPLSGYARRRLR